MQDKKLIYILLIIALILSLTSFSALIFLFFGGKRAAPKLTEIQERAGKIVSLPDKTGFIFAATNIIGGKIKKIGPDFIEIEYAPPGAEEKKEIRKALLTKDTKFIGNLPSGPRQVIALNDFKLEDEIGITAEEENIINKKEFRAKIVERLNAISPQSQ